MKCLPWDLKLCSVPSFLVASLIAVGMAQEPQRLKYNHPGLTVDLGVGLWAWPLPMDYDGDGDLDLVVSCPDYPYSGTYFFENPTGDKFPVFLPARRVGPALKNAQLSFIKGQPRLLVPGAELMDWKKSGFTRLEKIYSTSNVHNNKVRANQWRYADYDGDGKVDLIVGVGDWVEYGWDNAFNAAGHWTRGPLHGYVYWMKNLGDGKSGQTVPNYAKPVKLQADGQAVDVYGMPSPNLGDFDGDGDLDLLCGEFLDGFTYFENIGTATEPRYRAGQRLKHEGKPLAMDLEMITPTAVDWDGDGDLDLIVGDEDGRVALVEHTGRMESGVPQFLPPKYFQQQADEVKFGALVTPWSVDLDQDGDEDLVCGNSAGFIAWLENMDGGNLPKWSAPRLLEAAGKPIRVMAGENGSIQGPCEAKWGYTTLSVADWDKDGLHDLVVNSIWGRVVWYRHVGSKTAPKFAEAQPVQVNWPSAPPKPAWNWWNPQPQELATQWRTTPVAVDWTGDGWTDLVMLDHEGFLVLFQREPRDGVTLLRPGVRVFRGEGVSEFNGKQVPQNKESGWLRLNTGTAGASGRRKLCVADWDGDGQRDLLVNSASVNWLKNLGTAEGVTTFRDEGPLTKKILAGHTTSPTTVDWDANGKPDLLIGAEDGYLYYLQNK